MDMTAKKENVKNGLPFVQWLSIMLTLLSMVIAGFFYITNMEKRISLQEQQNKLQEQQQNKTSSELTDLQIIVNNGMGKRLELQRDYENMKQNFKDWREENNNSHNEIKAVLNKLLEEKRMAALKNNPDFVQ